MKLAPDASTDSFEHDSENVYEWMFVNIQGVGFSLNISREHGWAANGCRNSWRTDSILTSSCTIEESTLTSRTGNQSRWYVHNSATSIPYLPAGASAESVHRNQRPAKMFFIRLLTYSALRLGASCLAVAILCNAALGQDNTSTLIHGIMRNEMGKPVHNARVDVSTAAPISGPAVFSPSCYLERLD